MSPMIPTGFKSFDEKTGGLEPKKSYLLIGSKESGKEEFSYKLLESAASNNFSSVYVTTAKSATDLVNDFLARKINVSKFLGDKIIILDDFSRNVSPQAVGNPYTKILNGPVDLTGLSVTLSGVDNDFIKEGNMVVNILDSLSVLLLYNNPVTLFRFLQFIIGRAKISGITMFFLLDDKIHPQDVNETIKSICDGVISLKLENGKRYFTLTGVAKEVLEWTELQ